MARPKAAGKSRATEHSRSHAKSRPPAPPRADFTAAWTIAGLATIAIAAAALAFLAFARHPVGDYFTESDFYAGYLAGAAALQKGHFDFARYGVYGPGYEIALAAARFVVPEWFDAAKAIAVLSSVAILALAWWLARRRHGAAAAFALVLLIASNATFTRYGYSVGTDVPGHLLWLSSLCAWFALGTTAGPLAAGALAALAALTRYNLVSLVPAALLVALMLRQGARARLRAAGIFLAAFLAIVLPYSLTASFAGHPPGETLTADAAFYLGENPEAKLESRYGDLASGAPQPSPPPARATFAELPRRLLSGVPAHAAADARQLLGLPTVALVLAAIGVLTFARAAGPLVPLLPFALFTFLALAPIYYSERYSMVLLPLYLWPVAAAVEWAMRRGAAFGAIALLLVLAAAGLNLRHSAAVQSEVALLLPRETIPAGRAIRALAQPGDRVLARKGHAAYAAGLEPVLFPDVGTLDSLGEFCRRRGVRWLFYSWYEARLRPRLGFLLDTAASVPGLAPVHATHELPSATYRIEENFGATPAWWSDATVKSHIERRVSAMLAPPSESGPRFLALASEALDQGRPEDARVDAMDARLRMEKDPRALVLLGAALLQLGRPAESLDAADRALELDRTFAGAHLGRGLALKALGRNAEAAREWRPLASSSRDPRVLQAMIEVFVEQHDEAAAAEARAALESLRPTR